MLKNKFGADYQALGRRSQLTRDEYPQTETLTPEDLEAIWERFRDGEDYDDVKRLIRSEGVNEEDLKKVLRWLDDMGLRYFGARTQYKMHRRRVLIGVVVLFLGFICVGLNVVYGQPEYLFVWAVPGAGIFLFIKNYGKLTALKQDLEGY